MHSHSTSKFSAVWPKSQPHLRRLLRRVSDKDFLLAGNYLYFWRPEAGHDDSVEVHSSIPRPFGNSRLHSRSSFRRVQHAAQPEEPRDRGQLRHVGQRERGGRQHEQPELDPASLAAAGQRSDDDGPARVLQRAAEAGARDGDGGADDGPWRPAESAGELLSIKMTQ